MFVPENYEDYRYLVSYSNNYVVLTNKHQVSASYQDPTSIPILIQYFVPSIYSIRSTQSFTSDRSFSSIETGSSIYDRADFPNILCATFCLGLFIVFLINGLTRLVKRGGIFFGS